MWSVIGKNKHLTNTLSGRTWFDQTTVGDCWKSGKTKEKWELEEVLFCFCPV